MVCNTKIEKDSYDFFKKIENYIINTEKVFSDDSRVQYSNGCTSFSTVYQSQNAEAAKNICEGFTKLYRSLSPYKTNGKSDPNYKNDCKFLNYWLNSKLRENNYYRTVCVNGFYNNMEHHCIDTLPVLTSLDYIYDINEDDLNKMKKLYKLHAQLIKIYNILNKSSEGKPYSSLTLSEESLADYRTLSSKCNGNSNESCNPLQDFIGKYEQLYLIAQRKGEEYTKYFIQLTEQGNKSIILTPLLCSVAGLIPLLGILYKFTPMGQIFRSKNKKFTKEYSNNYNKQISLQQESYNIKYDSVA
ncbi:unnamed protein product [Plasmodium vivax]|uniref:(malaria parasite P. vivax) hypothetical protein n=1 Tax=Plasmodium vivax TaxID=5855 RepID=A0A8S4H3K5_PLAVI|nr:unnamed protein product [Plasmodium vivax]